MALTIGYDPSRTDLPRSIAMGLQYAQRGRQLSAEEEERKRADESFRMQLAQQKLLAGEREVGMQRRFETGEERRAGEFGRTLGFEEEKFGLAVDKFEEIKRMNVLTREDVVFNQQQAQKDFLLAQQQLRVHTMNVQGSMLGVAGRTPAIAPAILGLIEDYKKAGKVPGKKEVVISTASQQLNDLLGKTSLQARMQGAEDAQVGGQLQSRFQQAAENLRVSAEAVQDKAEFDEGKVVFEATSKSLSDFGGTGSQWNLYVKGHLDSENPLTQRVGMELQKRITPQMIDASLMMDNPENAREAMALSGLLPEEQENLLALARLEKYGSDSMPSDIQLMTWAKEVVNSIRTERFYLKEGEVDADVLAMRKALGDDTLEATVENFFNYGKTFTSMTNEEQIRIMFPYREKRKEAAKTKEKTKTKEVKGEERVKVKDKEGNEFTIPKNQLEEAKKQDYVLVEENE